MMKKCTQVHFSFLFCIAIIKGVKQMQRRKSRKPKPIFLPVIRNAAAGLALLMILVLFLALAVKKYEWEDDTIALCIQIIKTGILLFVALMTIKNVHHHRIAAPVCADLAFVGIAFVIFCMVEGSVGNLRLLLTDLAMGGGIGAVSGFVISKIQDAQAAKSVKNT